MLIEMLKLVLRNIGVPVVAQRKWIWLVSMRTQVWSPALLSELRIQRCCELWCSSKTWVGSGVAMAMAQAKGYSSVLTPSLGTSVCCKCSPKKEKKEKRELEHVSNKMSNQIIYHNLYKINILKSYIYGHYN